MSVANYCPKCGHRVVSEAVYCLQCGHALPTTADVRAPAAPPSSQPSRVSSVEQPGGTKSLRLWLWIGGAVLVAYFIYRAAVDAETAGAVGSIAGLIISAGVFAGIVVLAIRLGGAIRRRLSRNKAVGP